MDETENKQGDWIDFEPIKQEEPEKPQDGKKIFMNIALVFAIVALMYSCFWFGQYWNCSHSGGTLTKEGCLKLTELGVCRYEDKLFTVPDSDLYKFNLSATDIKPTIVE